MKGQLSFINTLAQLAANPGSEALRTELAGLVAQRGPSSPELHQFLLEILRYTAPQIHLEKEGIPIATFHLGLGAQQAGQLLSGHYLLRLSTGRLLWEDTLTDVDLCHHHDSELRLAAASEPGQSTISREESLAGGALVLEVIPGFHGGTMRLESRKENV